MLGLEWLVGWESAGCCLFACCCLVVGCLVVVDWLLGGCCLVVGCAVLAADSRLRLAGCWCRLQVSNAGASCQ